MPTITGTDGDDDLSDFVSGSLEYPGAEVSGLEGDDNISLSGANSTGDGGDGDDVIASTIYDSASFDYGASGVSVARVDAFAHNMSGGAGNDLMHLSAGSSVVDGGTGYDTISLAYATGYFFSQKHPGYEWPERMTRLKK